jgi:hypothetical protein
LVIVAKLSYFSVFGGNRAIVGDCPSPFVPRAGSALGGSGHFLIKLELGHLRSITINVAAHLLRFYESGAVTSALEFSKEGIMNQ